MGIAVRNHDLSNRWFKAVAKRAAAGILALGALCACGGGGGGGTPAPAPVIKTFQATPSTILAGGSVTLSAAYGNGAGTVDQGVGALAAGGSVQVKPTKDTTYTLTVKDGKNAPVQAQASVKVARPRRRLFTSGPFSTNPASMVSLIV